MIPGILEEMTLDDVRAFGPEVVVLGVGSTEPHGPVLPYGTDAFACDALCRRAVRLANEKGARVLGELYVAYRDEPRHLPAQARERFRVDGEARAVADYVAGMTDRFAMAEHWRILGSHEPF